MICFRRPQPQDLRSRSVGCRPVDGTDGTLETFFSSAEVVPSGYVKIAIENDPVEIVDLPIDSMVIFHSYVGLPEGTSKIMSQLFQNSCRFWQIAPILASRIYTSWQGKPQDGEKPKMDCHPKKSPSKITINGWYKPKCYRSIMVYYWVANILATFCKKNESTPTVSTLISLFFLRYLHVSRSTWRQTAGLRVFRSSPVFQLTKNSEQIWVCYWKWGLNPQW